MMDAPAAGFKTAASMPCTMPGRMRTSLIVALVVVLAAVAGVVLLMRALGRVRRKARRADAADLSGIRRYAESRGLTVQQAASKSAFTATGTLEGLAVTLSTSHLRLVVTHGRVAQGPIETHLRTRGLSPALRMLVARPVRQRREVEEPLTRGADRLSSGDRSFDAHFQCYAADPEQLRRWLDPAARQQIRALGELREVRLADGELSLSLVPEVWLGGADASPWHHVHPLVRKPETLDRAATLLARLSESAKGLGG